jgi:hypothetical protein
VASQGGMVVVGLTDGSGTLGAVPAGVVVEEVWADTGSAGRPDTTSAAMHAPAARAEARPFTAW